MSGIAISDDAVNLFYYMKAKSTYRWAIWGVNGNGSEVTCVLNAWDSAGPHGTLRFCLHDCLLEMAPGVSHWQHGLISGGAACQSQQRVSIQQGSGCDQL